MFRTAFAMFVLFLGCSFVGGETLMSASATTKPLLDAYVACVTSRARSFAGSADSAESIVKDAMGACAVHRRTLGDVVRTAGVSLEELTEFLNKSDGQVHKAASEAVLEERNAH
jgi:hypothetical protein